MADIILRHPPGTITKDIKNNAVIVTLINGQQVTLDAALADIWQLANGRPISTSSSDQPALIALRLAGLLEPPLSCATKLPTIPNPPPLVSVIIVTRNGRHHLAECLPSLTNQTYPHLEIIIVDDASTDDTIDFLNNYDSQIQVVTQTNGPNFAAGCNLGAIHANGDYLFFVNNDTRLESTCIQQLVAAHGQDLHTAGVAAMLRLYHHPPFINGLGTSLRRFGFGYDIGIGSLDVGQFENVNEVPALCFGAALISRTAWELVGPLDERYQFYYEDVDWSWRARQQGFRLKAGPQALVYHKFSASMNLQPSSFKMRLATRNRLWFVAKNFPVTAVPGQLLRYGLDDTARLLQAVRRGQIAQARAIVSAWGQYLTGLPSIITARKKTSRQQIKDFWALTRHFHPPIGLGDTPLLTKDLVTNDYRPFLLNLARGKKTPRNRLLIISPDAVHSHMGGVGIRYWELAQQLAETSEVTLAVPQPTDLSNPQISIHHYQEGNEKSLQSLTNSADIILLSGFTAYHHPFLRNHPAYKIIDLYDPMILENLERFADRPLVERQGLHAVGVRTFNDLFQMGDFFICASEKQRDYWLGALTATNRVNPAVYDLDPTLRRLIDLVPFGLPAAPPIATQPVLKGIRPGIGREDKVILWGGGLWDWLDPLTAIAAMPTVLAQVPTAKLFFLGTRHPNPNVPMSQMAQRALALAEELELRDTAVFFNEWTPYLERVNYLCEADVAISLHGDHIETRFAVRTRLMDYLWASLPMVVGGGDVLSDLVEQHNLGIVVATGDKIAVAESLIRLLQTATEKTRFVELQRLFHWSQVSKPIKMYVKEPWRNAGGYAEATVTSVSTPLWRLPGRGWQSLQQRGIPGLWQDVKNYLRWIQQQ